MLTKAGERAKLFLEEAGFMNPEEEYRVEVTRDVLNNRLSDGPNSPSVGEPVVETYKSLEDVGVAFVKFCAEHTTGRVRHDGQLIMTDKKFQWKHVWVVKELMTTEFKASTGSVEKATIKIIESSRAEAKLLTVLPKLEVVE